MLNYVSFINFDCSIKLFHLSLFLANNRQKSFLYWPDFKIFTSYRYFYKVFLCPQFQQTQLEMSFSFNLFRYCYLLLFLMGMVTASIIFRCFFFVSKTCRYFVSSLPGFFVFFFYINLQINNVPNCLTRLLISNCVCGNGYLL